MISKNWESQYAGQTIRVENRAFTERLYIDGKLVDEKKMSGISALLRGTIKAADGSTETVMVFIYPQWFSVGCAIVVGQELAPTLVDR